VLWPWLKGTDGFWKTGIQEIIVEASLLNLIDIAGCNINRIRKYNPGNGLSARWSD
jgi:hypothetical protein